MALSPKRRSSSRTPLHNFTFPNNLKWAHRVLRCSKTDRNSNHPPSVSEPDRRLALKNSKPSSSSSPLVNLANQKSPASEIKAVREKIMEDLRVKTERMKIDMLKEKPNGKEKRKEKVLKNESNFASPWSMRTRSGAAKGFGFQADEMMERPKFSLTLSKEEIESDFLAMTGAKPPRRPMKRPKPVQRTLDNLAPGMWLSEITADRYEVDDGFPVNAKGQWRK